MEKVTNATDTPQTDYKLTVNVGMFTILGIIALLIITSNIFTIIVIAVTEKLRNVTGYLMISLAFADLGVGIMITIPMIYAGFMHTLTIVACDAIGYLSSVNWMVSVYTLTLLSVDRLIAIVHPLQYINLVTTKRCIVAVLIVWLFAFILWLFPLINIGSFNFNDEEVCTIVICYNSIFYLLVFYMLHQIVFNFPFFQDI
jgi:hypothetical protein